MEHLELLGRPGDRDFEVDPDSTEPNGDDESPDTDSLEPYDPDTDPPKN